MKIGIIGAGMVGGALTKALARRGHDVIVASSNSKSEKMRALLQETQNKVRAGTGAEAARHGEIIILATPWPSTQSIIAGLGDLSGKIIIDATNPIKPDFSGMEFFENSSGGEQIGRWASGAHVVKTLNQIGFELMDSPQVAAGTPVMYLAGDNLEAKKTVAALVSELGFAPEDCGPLSMARYLESLAWLWINRAMIQGKAQHFALVLSDAAPGNA